MTSFNRDRPQVKPTRPARPFAAGLIDPETGRIVRPAPYTQADLDWHAQASNAAATDYEVLFAAPRPIAGGSPEADDARAGREAIQAVETSAPTAAAPAIAAALVVTIRGRRYRVRPVPCDRSAALKCYEVRKADGTCYHVSQHGHGCECTCPDFVFNRDGRDPRGCKHVRELVALGMLDAAVDVPPRASGRRPLPRRATVPGRPWTDADQALAHGGV